MDNSDVDAREDPSGSDKAKRPLGSCDLCKRMKIKCDRQQGSKCSHCRARNAQCTVTVVEKRKPQVKRSDYLISIEERIRRMESVIQQSGLASVSLDRGDSRERKRSPSVKSIDDQSLEDKLSMLAINDKGESKFVGFSSGFSLLSDRGLDWISEKLGTTTVKEFIIQCQLSDSAFPERYSTALFRFMEKKDRTPLPSEKVAQEYATVYFNHFNRLYPIFDEEDFMELLRQQYSSKPPTSVSWYACLNVVLAMGYLSKQSVQPGGATEFSKEDYTQFVRNAGSVLVDLMFGNTDLGAVQAVLGMAFIVESSNDPHPHWMLATIAARLALTTGLHRSLAGYGKVPPKLARQRQIIFWITYVVDKEASLRLGRPATIWDGEISIEVPNEKDFPDQPDNPSTLRHMATLALIESRVQSKLYSAKSYKKTPEARLLIVGELDEQLQSWKDDLPEQIRPDRKLQFEDPKTFPIVLMHFRYFNCLAAIHRISVYHHSYAVDEASGSPTANSADKVNPRVYGSAALCISAARNVVNLTRYFTIDNGSRMHLVWSGLYHGLAAFLALFTHVIQHPQDPRAQSDLELMKNALALLRQPASSASNSYGAKSYYNIFNRLRDAAVEKVKKAQKQPPRAKRSFEIQDDDQTSVPTPHIRPSPPAQKPSPPAGRGRINFRATPSLHRGSSAASIPPEQRSPPPTSPAGPAGLTGLTGMAGPTAEPLGNPLEFTFPFGAAPAGIATYPFAPHFSPQAVPQQMNVPPDLWVMPPSFNWDTAFLWPSGDGGMMPPGLDGGGGEGDGGGPYQ